MSGITIYTDSTSTIDFKWLEEHNVKSIKLSYTIDDKEYIDDGTEESAAIFYQMLKNGKMPKTSAIRFIPQFMEEMGAVMEAQTARGVEFDTKNGFKKIGMMLPLCMPLLISSVRKADGTAVAAEVRGFNLRTAQSGYKSYPFALRDFIAILLCVILLTGAVMI